jgi:hypothetical protein
MYEASVETLSPRERFEHDLFRARADVWRLAEAARKHGINQTDADRIKGEIVDLINDCWGLYSDVQAATK